MAFGEDGAIQEYAKLVDSFPTLWKDEGFIDVPKQDWMRIPLRDDWQSHR